LHRNGLPVVLIDDRGYRPGFPSVSPTNREGGASAAQHLLERGRRQPVVVTGPESLGCTQDRLLGFVETYRDAGFPLGPDRIVDGDFTFDGGAEAIRGLLAAGARFDAIFAHNDLSAAGALRALSEARLRVPDDVAVVGFDDVPMASYTEPPLTTVRQELRGMGETAAQLLMRHFDGEPLPAAPVMLGTSLIPRGST
jgi:LacI family transcriptional regulator